jgi:hypothetical protein
MTEQLSTLVVFLATVAGIVAVVYLDRRGQIPALTAIREVREALNQILVNTEKTNNSLRDQRRVLYDAHKRICAVTKGVEKPAP